MTITIESAMLRSRKVWAVGDSITDQGVAWDSGAYNVERRTQGGLWQNQTAWSTWATLASEARWTFAGMAATAGYTPAQILAEHVPTIIGLASPGDTVVVLAGTNGTSTALPDVKAIHQAFRDAGLRTVAVTIPPRSNAINTAVPFNAALAEWAQEFGVPLADGYAALVDLSTGQYVPAYDSGDSVHPSESGAKALGEAIATTLNAMHPASAALAKTNATLNGYFQTKPLALDAPTDPADFNRLADVGSGSFSVGDFPAARGGKGYVAINGDVNLTGRYGTYALIEGHRIRLGMALDVDLPVGGNFMFRFDSNTTGTKTLWAMGYHSNGSVRVLTHSVHDRRFYVEFTVPAGYTDTYRLRFNLKGSGSVLKASEITVADLTALGVE